MIETLVRVKFIQRNGTGVLVISPTRELALQIYDEARKLCKHLNQTHGTEDLIFKYFDFSEMKFIEYTCLS